MSNLRTISCNLCNQILFPTKKINDKYNCPLCISTHTEIFLEDIYICLECKILFKIGCFHNSSSNHSVYNGEFMYQFLDCKTNKEHTGMLNFYSNLDAMKFKKNIEDGNIKVFFECSCGGRSNTCRANIVPPNPHIDRLSIYPE